VPALNVTALWGLLKGTFTQWNADKPFQLAAALSYYTLFSLAPLLIIAIAVAGLVFGQEAAQHQIVGAIQGIVGRQSAEAIQEMIKNAGTRGAGITATLLGVGTLLIGAGGVVGQLQDSLRHCQLTGSQPEMTTIYCGYDFFECPILYHFTLS
jgi:membrane protein